MLSKSHGFRPLARASYRLSIIPGVLFAVSLGTVGAYAESVTRPKFRSGLWHFERTVEYVRRPPNENLVLSKTDATRCVDPNIAMTGVFDSPSVGSCRSEKPQLFGNQYVFSNRCDFMGPVSTVLTAESDAAYTEVNLLESKPLPKRDTVTARRVGECQRADQNLEVSSAGVSRNR
jgi:hypothetical protein